MLELFYENLHCMFIDMAFYIMLGLFFVGLLNTYVKREKVLSLLGKDSVSSVVLASVIGVPLPLCSCGVVPTAVELKKSGASNGAVTSFLVSTPQTGVDSMLATYSMMGIVMAVFRPFAAFVSGIITGTFVNTFAKNEKINVDVKASCCSSSHHVEETNSCCSGSEKVEETCCCSSHVEESTCGCSEKVEESCCCSSQAKESTCGCSEKVEETCCSSQAEESTCGCSEKVEETCCSSQAEESTCGCSHVVETSCCSSKPKENLTGLPKFLRVFKYAYGEFLDDISLHFVVGLLLATVIATFVPADFFVSLGLNSGIISMLAMVLIGLPMYICSTSSIPIALSLITKGLSLGSAFVFLFTGPVTNIASILMLSTVLGKKITTMYISIVILCSVGFGLLLDYFVSASDIQIINQINTSHHSGHFTHIISFVFLLLLIRSLIKVVPRKFAK